MLTCSVSNVQPRWPPDDTTSSDHHELEADNWEPLRRLSIWATCGLSCVLPQIGPTVQQRRPNDVAEKRQNIGMAGRLLTLDEIESFKAVRDFPASEILPQVEQTVRGLDEREELEPFIRAILTDTEPY